MARPDPNASDWSDLDLLTVEEAVERLAAEIAVTTTDLAELPEGPAQVAARRRLRLLEAARERVARGSSRPLPGETS
jgi:hypothetical protein